MSEALVLYGIEWETYRRLRDELDADDQSNIRLTYDEGRLAFGNNRLPIQCERERLLSAIVEIIAEESERDFVGRGNTTFQRPDRGLGGELDVSFCFQVRDALPQELDLVIEVELISPSVNRQKLYAALNIREMWQDNGQSVRIFALDAIRGVYNVASASPLFSCLDAAALTQFVEDGLAQRSTAWRREMRHWARDHQVS